MLSLFGSTSPYSYSPQSIGVSTLAGYYEARSFAALARSPNANEAIARGQNPAGPPPPWDPASNTPAEAALARTVLADGRFVDRTLGEFSDLEAPRDHQRLFALHQGLKKLWALAGEAGGASLSDARRTLLETRFQEGWAQVSRFVADTAFDKVNLSFGVARETVQSTAAIARGVESYTTGVVHDGAFDAEVAAFAGPLSFTLDAARPDGSTTTVTVDLADMGATPRTLDAVAAHINAALEAAGLSTRFSRVKIGEPDSSGVIPGTSFGFKVDGVSTEALTFSAADATASLSVVGMSGAPSGVRAGQVTRLTDIGGADPIIAASRRIEATGGPVQAVDDVLASVRAFEAKTGVTIAPAAATTSASTETSAADVSVVAARQAPDGGLVVALQTSGAIGGAPASRASGGDLTLVKYDSAGAQIWSRTLGASEAARASDLVIDAAGDIYLTGAISGAFGDTLDTGGDDGFVAKYSASGSEVFVTRFGSSSDEAPARIAVDEAGRIFVAGSTGASLDGAAALGDRDGFVRALDANGAHLWTRQLGTDQIDRATALAASGGAVYVGSQENGSAFVRKFAADEGVSGPVWTEALGGLDGGRIAALRVDGASVFAVGAAGASADLITGAGGGAGGRDGFVLKLDDAGVSVSRAFVSVVGGAGEDSVEDLTLSGGTAYLTGLAGSDLATGDALSTGAQALVASVGGGDGTLNWARQIVGRDGQAAGVSIAVDAVGASSLSRLGLPAGAMTFRDTDVVSARTAARVGDSFSISIDGGRAKTVTLKAGDTMQSLATSVQNALLVAGKATAAPTSDGAALRIAPREGVTVTLGRGPDGRDLLAALGLTPGEVETKPEDPDPDLVFGALGLPDRLSLGAPDTARTARSTLEAAMSGVRDVFRELTISPEVKALLSGETARRASGPVPAYLTARIAAYQDALVRISSLV